mmetsp:Transcript_425/g.511  ORF Transcript_425/g.511 Transcript_425/m.511 type:complete len:143 (+) Transcript_425:1101-1529(+)
MTVMERSEILHKEQKDLIPRTLFITRERDGTILLGLEYFKPLWSKVVCEKLKSKLLTLGWEMSYTCIGEVKDDNESRYVIYDLAELEKVERFMPSEVVTDLVGVKSAVIDHVLGVISANVSFEEATSSGSCGIIESSFWESG